MSDSGLKNLAGFPMLMAVSESAINNQLKSVATTTHDLPDSWELPEKPAKDDPDYAAKMKDYKKTGYHFKVEKFDAPQVDFNTTREGCRLILPINKGSFFTFAISMDDDGNPHVTKNEVDLSGIKILAVTQVNQIVHDDFSDELFEVQSLYADLERVSLVDFELSKKVDVAALGVAKSSLQTLIQDKIQDIGKKNPTALLFGQVSIPKLETCKKAVGSLSPTASTYSVSRVYDQKKNYMSGSLNYLLWTGEAKDMPSGGAAGVFSNNWVDDGQEGIFVLSDTVLLQQFVIPAMQKTFAGIQFTVTEGNSVADIKAKAILTSNYPFSYKKLHDPEFTKLDITVEGAQIEYDYSFTFQHKVMALYEHYRATGSAYTTIGMDKGQLTTTISSPEPYVEKLKEGFWHDFAQGLALGFSLGFATFAYDHDQSKGFDLGEAFKLSFEANVSPVPKLVQLPGQAVFSYTDVNLFNQLKVDCKYSTDTTRPDCKEG